MSNMHHCRFENTAKNLRECYEDFDSQELAEEEKRARKSIYRLCKNIIDNFEIEDLE